ncbi:helix-turn-helix transcriptional regulator [Caldalkalibacillus salinus]|uniref:helix-turn-helix transcriptional regulator n=1 Tax=Caldalkalibacillus salinus TaxID=2803787 RepID=UPI001921B011|nr:helix-turn-helix transcriptional regulator [Caldalkalibacillus salinus]
MRPITFHDLTHICQLAQSAIGVPLMIVAQDKTVLASYAEIEIPHPFSKSSHTSQLECFELESDVADTLVLQKNASLEQFISVQVTLSDGQNVCIIVGPCISYKLNRDALVSLLHDIGQSYDQPQFEMIQQYYDQLAVVDKPRLVKIGLMLYYMVYGKHLDVEDVVQKNTDVQFSDQVELNPDLTLSRKRQELSFHHHVLHEKNVLQCIKEGRKKELLKLTNQAPEGEFGLLSKKSYLRHTKNLSICAIALATRAAMEGGVHQEVAYTVSDLYIQAIEELQDVNDVQHIMTKGLAEFAERVQHDKSNRYSKPVKMCHEYIDQFLYEKISLNELAQHVNLNPSYLSQLFQRETGVTISVYIQQERVKEAQKLLRLTNQSLADICTWLQFHDQSYFTKVFKKYTGDTPRRYKNKYSII